MLLLRSIFFTFLLPGTVTVAIPYWILSSREVAVISQGQPFRYLGVPLIVIGGAGLLWCIWQFFSEGRGTLSPIDAPKQLVVRGLYRYVRNPMYVAVTAIVLGEAMIARSLDLVAYWAAFF